MYNFGVRFVASLIPSRIFQRRKTEPKTEEVKRQHRHQPLQQFFTSFTNRNRTLGEKYKIAGQQSIAITCTSIQDWVLPAKVNQSNVPLVLGIRQKSKAATTKTISVIVRIGAL